MSKMKKIVLAIALLIVALAIIIIVTKMYKTQTTEESAENLEVTSLSATYDSSDLDESTNDVTTTITLADNNTQITGSGATVSENTITITSAGTYYITGTLTDGNIIIETTKKDNVKLILDGVSIKSSNMPAIYCKEAKKLIITLKDGTTNYLEDGNNYSYTDNGEPDGAIFSMSDLTINGKGSLEVKANYKDGIVSKDGLNIIDATVKVTSADDGIRGKDYVQISNATVQVNSTGDGIKSTNEEELGYVVIENSDIDISSGTDGIQAKSLVDIKSGNINITTAGGNTSSKKTTSSNGFYTTSQTSTDSSSSAKAIKATTEVNIEGGTITIDSSDDSIHSNGNVIISGGTITAKSGDDGIHADSNVVISNAAVDIQKSYEGIEGMYIEIDSGTISIVSSDDGINVAGGTDSSSVNGRSGQNSFNSNNSNLKLVINEGTITVNATGDGLDSNGSMYINGGTITVYGPTANDNAALDYNGECIVTGGTLIAIGSSGMMQAPSSTSTQCSFTTTISGSAGDTIAIKTSSGEELISFTAQKSYQMLTFSSNKLQTGESYQIYVNGSLKTTISQSSTTTQIGSSSMGGQGGMKH